MSDADVLITNHEFSLEALIERRFNKPFVISSEIGSGVDSNGNAYVQQMDTVCTGGFFVKCDEWVFAFLQQWMGMDHDAYPGFWEQDALLELIQNPQVDTCNIQVIPNQSLFNSFPTYCQRCWKPGDFLCHAAKWQGEHMQSLFCLMKKLHTFGTVTPKLNGTYVSDGQLIVLHDYGFFECFKHASMLGSGDWMPMDQCIVGLLPQGQTHWQFVRIKNEGE